MSSPMLSQTAPDKYVASNGKEPLVRARACGQDRFRDDDSRPGLLDVRVDKEAFLWIEATSRTSWKFGACEKSEASDSFRLGSSQVAGCRFRQG